MRVNEQGRSMIEMLGVLAIVGVLSVGGIAGYSKAMNKFKTNKVIDQINMISTNIRTLYSSQRSYKGLNNEVAIQTGLIPGEMYDTGSTDTTKITHAFAGAVEITPAAVASGGANSSYVIAIDGVPAASCVSIITTDWGGDAGSGLLGISAVPGVATGANPAAASAQAKLSAASIEANASTAVPGNANYGLPFSIVNAHSACGSNGNAAIAWKFL